MRNRNVIGSTRRIPAPIVIDWPLTAADALHLRHVLAQHDGLEYGLHIHDYAATPQVHVVFFLRTARTA